MSPQLISRSWGKSITPRFETLLTFDSFFVNELGQIRMIEAPDKEYYFHSTNNERFNEMLREAMQGMTARELVYIVLTLRRVLASRD
jgi:hypothetical protein